MDKNSLNKRKSTLRRRIAELSAKPDDSVDRKKFFESRYHFEALRGQHPFLLPAPSAEDRIERQSYFQSLRPDARTLYSEKVEPSATSNQLWYPKIQARIAIIADEFLFKSFESAGNLIPLTPTNYKEVAQSADLLLVTSTWRGLALEWDKAAQKKSAKRKLIEDSIIPYFKARGIPTAFYSKEDPPNYSTFLSLAEHCDYIFTSAVEMIEKYKVSCPSAKEVSVLPFSVDFKHHNPVGSRSFRIDDIVFAGSWHNHKYQERRLAAEVIFDGVIDAGRTLRIIDRNSKLANPRYSYPEQYLPYVEDAVPHDFLLNMHRHSDFVINLNSVVDSSSMYANRVVELQAMGCAVISNYNAGVNDQFPNVFIPEAASDVVEFLTSFDERSLYYTQMRGLRNVYRDHVNFDRIGHMLDVVGISSNRAAHEIAVVGDQPRHVEEFVSKQITEASLSVFSSVEEAKQAGASAVVDVDSGLSYGRNYVQDLVNATKFVDSRTVRKADSSVPLNKQHDYSHSSGPAGYSLTWLGENSSQASSHAYVIDDFEIENVAASTIEVQPHRRDYKLSVVVPVYNNGSHLRFKCFESLRRSSIFTDMEVLLIDDGSTDSDTRATVLELGRQFDNVVVHLNPVGGSGSASRPRNQGLEMASAPWITYLDPDNEATSDGFARLLDLARSTGAEFAIGNMVRNSDRRKLINNCRILRKHLLPTETNGLYIVPDDILRKINFTPMSIQALVASTSWLRSLGIYQPVGAVGQDSYFFQQMVHYASRIGVLNAPIHIYYAAVSNSTVNTIGPKFYRKYLPLEQDRAAWLKEVGLLEHYNSRRLEAFVKGWYVQKLDRVPENERDEAKSIIRELVGFYEKSTWKDPDLTEFFS
ncbi:hypothetical protein GCM10027417_27640 [Glutamicibacter endophyticus]